VIPEGKKKPKTTYLMIYTGHFILQDLDKYNCKQGAEKEDIPN